MVTTHVRPLLLWALGSLLLFSACAEPTPCDGLSGTCLNVYLNSSGGERVDQVKFLSEADAFKHEQTWSAKPGGQLLPLLLALQIPDEAQRTVKLSAQAIFEGKVILTGQRVLAEVTPGSQRSVVLSLAVPGIGGGAMCMNGRQDGAETGVDCGGSCVPCEPGCADGIKNGNETDVDCGGPCQPCLSTKSCLQAKDCATQKCEGNKCAAGLGLVSLSPPSGPTFGGVEVTLRGEGFTQGMQVRLGGAACTITKLEPEMLTLNLPAGKAGRADLMVESGQGKISLQGAFGYYYGMLRFGQQPPVTYKTGTKPYYMVTGHLNEKTDKHLDVVVLNEVGGSISVFLGNGDGSFQSMGETPVADMLPLQIQLGDLNGDGVLDVVSANHRLPTVSVLLGKGDGSFDKAAQYSLPQRGAMKAWPNALALADFNGDKLADVAVTELENSGSLYIFLAEGNRSGKLSTPTPMTGIALSANNPEPAVTAGDFNKDGKADVAVTLSAPQLARVFLGNGDGTFRPGTDTALATVGPHSITQMDMNGDGNVDLVVAGRGGGSVSVLLGKGDGTFARGRTTPSEVTPFAVSVGDLDGDQTPDVVVPNWMGTYMDLSRATLLFGDGSGGFPRSLAVGVPKVPYGAAVGDFNGDGRLDFVTGSITPSDTMAVYLNQSM